MRAALGGLAAACLMLSLSAASAQEMKPDMKMDMDHGSMDHGSMAKTSSKAAADAPSTKAFEKAGMAMHMAMKQTYTGDADRDFLTGMIPHHQGAIDMAKIVLTYGKDPQVKALAQGIVAAQEKEIAEMKAMLAAMDKPAAQ